MSKHKKSFLSNFLRLFNLPAPHPHSSRLIILLLVIHTAQLTTITPLITSMKFDSTILSQWHKILIYTSPIDRISFTSWTLLKALILTYLFAFLAVQICLFGLGFFKTASMSVKKRVLFVYRVLAALFEHIFFIPILIWVSLGFLNNPSKNWIYITAATLICISSVLLMISKFLDYSFKSFLTDHLRTSTRIFEFMRLLTPVLILALSIATKKEAVPVLAANIISCLHGIASINLGLFYATYRERATRKIHLGLMAGYLAHSLVQVFMEELKESVESWFFAVNYFISIPFFIKFFIAIDNGRVTDTMNFMNICSFVRQRGEIEEIVELLHAQPNAKHASPAIVFKIKAFVSKHIEFCQTKHCMCKRWEKNAIDSHDLNESLTACFDFIISYFEHLLKRSAKRHALRMIDLIDFVILEAVYLKKHIKASLNLTQLRGSFFTRYQQELLNALFRFVEENYVEQLTPKERLFYEAKFSNGISFDRKYLKLLDDITQIRKYTRDFYGYLLDSDRIILEKIYDKGKITLQARDDAEKKIEHFAETHKQSPEATSLLIYLKTEILRSDKSSLSGLQARLKALLSKRKASYLSSKEEDFKETDFRFDYIDYNNIFLTVDLTTNFGNILSYNTKLLEDLGYPEHYFSGSMISISKILPPGVGDGAVAVLQKFIREYSPADITKNYFKLVFLSDCNRFLLPYQTHMKIEFSDDQVYGTAVLRKVKTKSNFILTKASGEIISHTQGVSSEFGLEQLSALFGTNICLIIPELLNFYLPHKSNVTQLLSDSVHRTPVLNMQACWLGEIIKDTRRLNSMGFDKASQTLEKLNSFHSNFEGKDEVLVLERFASISSSLDMQVKRTYDVTLQVQNFELGNTMYKIVEVFEVKLKEEREVPSNPIMTRFNSNFYDSSQTPDPSPIFQKRKGIRKFTGDIMRSPPKKHKTISFGTRIQIDDNQPVEEIPQSQLSSNRLELSPSLPSNLVLKLLSSNSRRKSNFQSEVEPIRTEDQIPGYQDTDWQLLETYAGNERIDITARRFDSKADASPMRRESERRRDSEFSEIPREIINSSEREGETKRITLTLSGQGNEPPKKVPSHRGQEKKERKVPALFKLLTKFKILEIAQRKDTQVSKVSKVSAMRPASDTSSYIESFESDEEELNRESLDEFKQNTMLHETRKLLEKNVKYRILELSFLGGVLGIMIIASLFIGQYAQYSRGLEELAELSKAINSPLQLGLDMNMLVKEFYKWDLIVKDVIMPPEWYVPNAIGSAWPAYINVGYSFWTLIAAPENISGIVSEYLWNSSNYIELQLEGNETEVMAINQAAPLMWRAGLNYFNKAVKQGLHDSSTVRSSNILSENAANLYELYYGVNQMVMEEVEKKINYIMSFNIIMIVIVAVIIGLLTLCSLFVYNKVAGKRVQMLALLSRIQSSDIIEEITKLEELLFEEVVSLRAQNMTYKKAKTQRSQSFRLASGIKSQRKNKLLTVCSLILIFGIAMAPFIFSFVQTKTQTEAWNQSLLQANIWRLSQASLSSLMANTLRYYYYINATVEFKEEIYARRLDDLAKFTAVNAKLVDFLTGFENLPNRYAYSDAVADQITGGRDDMCTYMFDNELFTTLCRNSSQGIGNKGIIQSTNYFLQSLEVIRQKVDLAADQSQALLNFGKDIVLIETDLLQKCINRFLRYSADQMTSNFLDFMDNVASSALRIFLSIFFSVVLVLTVIWIVVIKKIEIWLNKTKALFTILSDRILENNTVIKNYFINELRASKNIF